MVTRCITKLYKTEEVVESNQGNTEGRWYSHGFWADLKREAAPIIKHGFVVLCLEFFVLSIGLMNLLLKHLLPTQVYYFQYLEAADIWVAMVLMSLFGFYTVATVARRLLIGLWTEFWHNILRK